MANKPNFNEPTKEEVAYYKDVEFDVTEEHIASIDGDRYESICASAVCDVITRAQKRTRKDFKSDAEYEVYKSALYAQALRIESGMWMK